MGTTNVIIEENPKLVSNHDAFDYLAEVYGFEIIDLRKPECLPQT